MWNSKHYFIYHALQGEIARVARNLSQTLFDKGYWDFVKLVLADEDVRLLDCGEDVPSAVLLSIEEQENLRRRREEETCYRGKTRVEKLDELKGLQVDRLGLKEALGG